MHSSFFNSYGISLLLVIVITSLPLTGHSAEKTEEPKFAVLDKTEEFEIREYEPRLVAETQVKGNRKEASSAGFRVLADYIFGNNTAQEDISMTAPVSQKPNVPAKSAKIEMTAPVTQTGDNNNWTIRFTMPAEYTTETLPRPNNPAVIIKQLPAKRFAVLRFSGYAVTKSIAEKSGKLLDAVKTAGIETIGEVELAQYDPPWTPGPQRRNEVLIAIVEK